MLLAISPVTIITSSQSCVPVGPTEPQNQSQPKISGGHDHWLLFHVGNRSGYHSWPRLLFLKAGHFVHLFVFLSVVDPRVGLVSSDLGQVPIKAPWESPLTQAGTRGCSPGLGAYLHLSQPWHFLKSLESLRVHLSLSPRAIPRWDLPILQKRNKTSVQSLCQVVSCSRPHSQQGAELEFEPRPLSGHFTCEETDREGVKIFQKSHFRKH